MAKLRYALAAIFFAASVGCLALWWRSMTSPDELRQSLYDFQSTTLHLQAYDGIEIVTYLNRSRTSRANDGWYFRAFERDDDDVGAFDRFDARLKRDGVFGTTARGVYFPLWYPALAFALAGVSVLRFRRQFSIRSAMIVTAVAAALAGMVVAL